MIEDGRAKPRRGLNVIVAMAAATIIVAGLKLGSELLVPVVLAFFLALLSLPVVEKLRSWRVPRFIATLITVAANLGVIVGVIIIVSGLTGKFQTGADQYGVRLYELTVELGTWLEEDLSVKGAKKAAVNFYDNESGGIRQLLDPATIAKSVLAQLTDFLKTTMFVVILMIFMLNEAGEYRRKMGFIAEASGPHLERFRNASRDIQKYLTIKTFISAITGTLAGVLCASVGLDFPILWGMVAFALNFIPAIGSIIASVPPTLLALVSPELGLGWALFILLGYLSINMALGNFIEPMLLGHRFGISTMVVVLSVLFWGWVWGPVGMFLAVPLSMMVKVGLDNTPEFRWLSIAMGNDRSLRQAIEPLTGEMFESSGSQADDGVNS